MLARRLVTAIVALLVPLASHGAQGDSAAGDRGARAGAGSVDLVRIGTMRAASGDSLRVAVDDVWDGNFYFGGGQLDVDGRIAGDLVVGSGKLEVSGRVDEDLIAGSGEIDLRGEIGDDVRAAAGRMNVSGTVGGELVYMGGDLTLEPTAVVGGAAVIWTSRVVLEGVIEGPVEIGAGLVEIDGRIGGDARIKCDGLTFGPQARIDGDLEYSSRNDVEIPDGAVGGRESRLEQPGAEKSEIVSEAIQEVGSALSVLWTLFSLYLALVGIIAGVLLWLLFRPLVDGAMRRVEHGSAVGVAFGVGLVSLLVMLVVGFACFFLGPLWLALWSAFGALVFFGNLIGKMVLGRLALQPLLRRSVHPLLGLLVGVALIFVIGFIPYVGALVWILVTITGMGVLLLQVRGGEDATTAPPKPQVAAGHGASPVAG